MQLLSSFASERSSVKMDNQLHSRSPPNAPSPSHPPQDVPVAPSSMIDSTKGEIIHSGVFKGPKRKRLVKACNACHKSKRRCDGTAPCSNCYFASKECRYTDAAGRVLPAPNSSRRAPGTGPGDIEQSYRSNSPDSDPQHHHTNLAATSEFSASTLSPEIVSDDANPHTNSRKRVRREQESYPATTDPAGHLNSPVLSGAANELGLDPSLTRELVNLFFAHCHPHCLIIHKPSFSSDLSLERVPSYLLNSLYALAAPLSRNTRIRTSPPRIAGQSFAHAALSLMFDRDDHLIAPPCLATAQALCFLQIHEFSVQTSAKSDVRYFNLALRILDSLDVQKLDSPILTPLPSLDWRKASVERECLRRTLWLIHLIELLSPMFVHGQVFSRTQDLVLRLPCDETSFELSTHSATPEYLSLPPHRVQYASEFGNLIRVSTIFNKIERLNIEKASDPRSVAECETTLQAWVSSLADHLQFSEDALHLQLSMWETSSNTSAWCFCFMHTLHACCVLALNHMKCRLNVKPITGQQSAQDKIFRVISSLGSRACNSVMMGIIHWLPRCMGPVSAQCHADESESQSYPDFEQQLEAWMRDYEELWGLGDDESLTNTPRASRSPKLPLSRAPAALSPASRDPSLTRFIGELRLQGPAATTHPNRHFRSLSADSQTEPRRWAGGSEHDAGLRAEARPREGRPPSLPSLKASGLLDSWRPADGSGALASAPSSSAAAPPWALLHRGADDHSVSPGPRDKSASRVSTPSSQYTNSNGPRSYIHTFTQPNQQDPSYSRRSNSRDSERHSSAMSTS